MVREGATAALSGFAVIVVGTICLWGLYVRPDRAGTWAFTAAAFALCVLIMECAKRPGLRADAVESHRSFMRLFFAGVAVCMAMAVGTKLAVATVLIDSVWLEAGRRSSGFLLGVLFVFFGNYLPKLPSPWSWQSEPFDWQGVHRFVGWLCALAGTAIAFAWLTLSVDSASRVQRTAMLAVVVLGVGRKLISLATWKGRSALR